MHDTPAPVVLSAPDAAPPSDLAARNAARIDKLKAELAAAQAELAAARTDADRAAAKSKVDRITDKLRLIDPS